MTVKERGAKTGIALSVFILFFSFTVGFLTNAIMSLTAVRL
jgi:hypothetical protein